MPALSSLTENIKSYTEIRNAANELLRYVSFASLSEIISTQAQSVQSVAQNSFATDEGALTEKLLGSTGAIPLYDQMVIEIVESGAVAVDESGNSNLDYAVIFAKPEEAESSDLKKKKISMMQHAALTRVDFSSTLTDIAAAFCNLVPPVEMSLCVPYFDVKIIYPQESSGLGQLSTLRFVGAKPGDKGDPLSPSVLHGYNSTDTKTKFGYDVAGMEIFCMPQTLAAPGYASNSESDLQQRGVQLLDPIMPLLTLESANIQQTGINGSLYAQTKIDLKLVLHDRSRLSDIEPLTSAEIFPTATFRVTYGWIHPDDNKLAGNVYAKLLNSMRVVQDFAVSSVSLSTKDAASMNLSISLISMGNQVAKGAKVMTAGGNLIPYTAIQTLLKQFIRVKSVKEKSKSDTTEFSSVGTTIIASTGAGTTNSKFVRIEDFYSLYKLVSELSGDNPSLDVSNLEQIITKLNQIETSGIVVTPDEEFNNIFRFGQVSNDRGEVEYGNLAPENLAKVSSKFRDLINPVMKQDNLFSPKSTGDRPTTVPLSALVAKLVAKPLVLTQPDIDEVRIHFFSFNSACGLMSEENIGNFPIVVKDLIEITEKEEKKSGINQRSSAEKALGLLLKYVNNPASPFYGHNSELLSREKLVEMMKDAESDSEKLQEEVDTIVETSEAAVDTKNAEYLEKKQIALVDTAFVPARIKSQIDVLPAYDTTSRDGSKGNPEKPDRKIARIVIYDERSGGFNKLGNLIFSMINTNGIARLNKSGNATSIIDEQVKEISSAYTVDDLFSKIRSTENTDVAKEVLVNFALTDKVVARQIASNMYPTLIIGANNSCISNATYSSQPSGEVQSAYLLTALQGGKSSSSTGQSVTNDLVDDVFILPSNVTLSMLGNVCINRGQTFYVDFNTGTTLDNSYTVQAVSHALRPGSFTTSATLVPTNSATMRSISRQLQEVAIKIKGKTGTATDPNKPASSSSGVKVSL